METHLQNSGANLLTRVVGGADSPQNPRFLGRNRTRMSLCVGFSTVSGSFASGSGANESVLALAAASPQMDAQLQMKERMDVADSDFETQVAERMKECLGQDKWEIDHEFCALPGSFSSLLHSVVSCASSTAASNSISPRL